jgi:hypothetical protein
MKRRKFIVTVIGAASAAAGTTALFATPVAAAIDPATDRYYQDNLHRDFSPCHYCDAKTWEQHKIGCPRESALCRSCGSKTDVDLIDTSRPFGPDRDRTVCFSCEPKAAVILHYSSEYAMRMAAATNKVKCSNCRKGAGYIYKHGTPFHYRLCGDCATEAKDCRRWVKDLRGWPRTKT